MSDKETDSVTLYYAEMETEALGNLWLAASEKGLIAVRFDEDSGQFLSNLLLEMDTADSPNIMHDEERLKPFMDSLTAYFAEKTPIPTSLPVDLTDQTEFQQEILRMVREIPFGATTTYGELADDIQNPNAARAIGQVLRRNPIPILIPCHRVLNADGTLGGYGGVMGSDRKITLLKHEGIILA
ncbi:MAG TPA: methylated-DNA--[protein]-cysteine S-methyltransferase [Anaerolineales bacterium]|nr:methylated-DNA--[protein]-cysteine S-methyltransferase [Anaerolineales bacterium]